MEMERIVETTGERIAASQAQAFRDLVRTNAMLADEVEMLRDKVRRLQAIAHGQNPQCPCQGCIWWNDWGLADPATHCENGATPDPWYSAAADGGVPGCPNYTPACRVCKVARATGDDGLCDGCRGARWPRNGGLARDVPAQQVQPAVETAGRQARLQKSRRQARSCVSCPSPTWYVNRP